MAMIEMVVEGIGIDPQSQTLVLLRDQERTTFVPIWIGQPEAISIQMELDKKQSPRPMTHDLMSNIFHELGIRLVKVTVNDFADQVYYASLHLQLPGDAQLQEIDARPSDAIALALRARCRIMVAAQVAEKTGIQIDEAIDDADEMERVEEPVEEPAPEELDKFMKLMDGVDLSGDSGKN